MKKDIICFHCGINKKSESPSRNPRPSDSDCTLILYHWATKNFNIKLRSDTVPAYCLVIKKLWVSPK